MNIGLIPLDERPVNTRYPAMIAQIAGVDLSMPPSELLSSLRRPAPCSDLANWLKDVVPDLDALVVSCEMLGYGGLIASRTTDEPASTIVARLGLLRELKQRRPGFTVVGFNLITRISNSNDPTEEPDYWESYGKKFYQLSQLIHRQAQGHSVAPELETLRSVLPKRHMRDFFRRRLRNHTVNLAVLQLLVDGVLDLLVLSSDDTSPYGLPSREKRWLIEWVERMALGDRLLMYPGADEVGCALLARLINAHAGFTPCFETDYAVPGGEQVVAAFEDEPVQVAVERQIRAVGGTVAGSDGNLWLGVNPPVEREGRWPRAYTDQERRQRMPHMKRFVEQVRQRQAAGQPVIVADVAFANGADAVLIDLMREHLDLTALAAYGAWNTAGNTIGVALAQGCAAQQIRTDTQRVAHERFLLHRFVEDWGYQRIVRPQVRQWLEAESGQFEPTAGNLATTVARVEQRLQELIDELPGFAGCYQIVAGSVRLPWQRVFEVDFELERVRDWENG